jgi:divalent metal cation (Fe/Co/Zn/Cd) transporter
LVEHYYGYRRRSDLGAIIVISIFIAAIAITIFVEYLLYGVLTSLFYF